jgi:hypothetical protein
VSPQVVVLERRHGRAALASSGRLVRGRWWHNASLTAIALTGVSALGIVVGLIVLITFTGLPLWALSVIVAASTCW